MNIWPPCCQKLSWERKCPFSGWRKPRSSVHSAQFINGSSSMVRQHFLPSSSIVSHWRLRRLWGPSRRKAVWIGTATGSPSARASLNRSTSNRYLQDPSPTYLLHRPPGLCKSVNMIIDKLFVDFMWLDEKNFVVFLIVLNKCKKEYTCIWT